MGQIMCATLVERVTGVSNADGIDVEIGITVGADTLLGADDTPAELDGYDPSPRASSMTSSPAPTAPSTAASSPTRSTTP